MSDNARVMALAGAAEHIAAGAPLYHPGMRDASMLTVRTVALQQKHAPSRGIASTRDCDYLQPPAAKAARGAPDGTGRSQHEMELRANHEHP